MKHSEVIVDALIKAAERGYEKPHDVALFIRVELKKRGLYIAKKPIRSKK